MLETSEHELLNYNNGDILTTGAIIAVGVGVFITKYEVRKGLEL